MYISSRASPSRLHAIFHMNGGIWAQIRWVFIICVWYVKKSVRLRNISGERGVYRSDRITFILIKLTRV